MKHLFIACAIAGLTTSVFAQSNTSPVPDTHHAPAAASYVSQQTPSYSAPVMTKTRAEVYQELVQAQQDGSLAQMNATTYAHH
jgi:hypothetical protein